MNVIPETDRAH